MSASVAHRRRSAYAAALAAKQRRKKIFLIVLLVAVAVVLAWELPGLIGRLSGSSSSPSASSTPAPTANPRRALPKVFRGSLDDPFVTRALADGDSRIAPAIGRDPFSGPQAATPTTPAEAQPLPQQIVIGKPSGRGIAQSGWIVILASIPTPQGRGAATSFARAARSRGIGDVSVLNSSNRRPLRGGYWVVYTGPVATLSDVERLASAVHGRGYGTAYIRQLLVYR